MGKNRKRTLRRDFKEGREDVWRENKRQKPGDWSDLEPRNEQFEEYYKAQNICPPEEWEEFLKTLAKPLPTTFRINGHGKFADDLRVRLEKDFFAEFHGGAVMVAGEVLEAPRPLAWYPDKLAWHFNFSRAQLRKHPMLEAIHELIKRENESGSITRQEAVSMVPPLFLDVRSEHRVLDTCAAPGSKTAQILEMLHYGTAMPTGIVVANDSDAQRCNLLTHQTKRMCSPALVVTNHDATTYPMVAPRGVPKEVGGVKYDRILCDVPCSGDGTIRKAQDIWRRWSAGNGNGLHPLQLRITLHACKLLETGGRLVYSTCTFNPIEDEAVVAEVLRKTKGSMELLDMSGHLPELKRLPGLKKWVATDKTNFYSSWDEARQHGPHKLLPSMFPDAESDKLPLERCMRILPHHSDTGGFFIAVLQKVAKLPDDLYHHDQKAVTPSTGTKAEAIEGGTAATVEAAPAGEAATAPEAAEAKGAEAAAKPAEAKDSAGACKPEADTEVGPSNAPAAGTAGSAAPAAGAAAPQWGPRGGGGRNRAGAGRWHGLDPVVPMTDPVMLGAICDFYGLSDDFPLFDQLVTRSLDTSRPKRLYFVSAGVRQLLLMDELEQLKVTSTGLKVFERQENKDSLSPCKYRVAQEGLPLLLPYITKQMVQLSATEFCQLINHRAIILPENLKRVTDKATGSAANAADGNAVEADDAAEEKDTEEAAPKDEGEQAKGSSQPQAGKQQQPQQQQPPKGEKPARIMWTDPRTLAQLETIQTGCCVCTIRDEEAVALGLNTSKQAPEALSVHAPLAICAWRGRGSFTVLVSKQECAQLAEKLAGLMKAQEGQANGQAQAAPP
ncbi:hypothetical protein WJX72_006165 [[Myrmecia] bisecta]|uniref:SAM-dependent MTase RsmB/NOP-type domain-containing protein n=1 Tax=[Myrmecia] bisecta TaxID=41462 RepID=A0AAW1Q2U2_9CHLO